MLLLKPWMYRVAVSDGGVYCTTFHSLPEATPFVCPSGKRCILRPSVVSPCRDSMHDIRPLLIQLSDVMNIVIDLDTKSRLSMYFTTHDIMFKK